jgi:hypothetical protein
MLQEDRMDQRNNDNDKGTFERMGEQLGGAAGRAFGRGSDMAANMFGSMFGTAMDSLGEWWSSPDASRAASSFDASRDRSCRDHFESTSSGGRSRQYDEVRPLYQFGHMAGQNPDYQGRDFEDIEPDLQRAWPTESKQSVGEWPEVRGYVGFGYSQDRADSPRDF